MTTLRSEKEQLEFALEVGPTGKQPKKNPNKIGKKYQVGGRITVLFIIFDFIFFLVDMEKILKSDVCS